MSQQAHDNDGAALGTENGSASLVEDGMDEDDEESDSGSESDREGLSVKEGVIS